MTKNDLINDVAYELRDSMTKEKIERMKITLYVKLQDFELAEIKQLPMTIEHDKLHRCNQVGIRSSEAAVIRKESNG